MRFLALAFVSCSSVAAALAFVACGSDADPPASSGETGDSSTVTEAGTEIPTKDAAAADGCAASGSPLGAVCAKREDCSCGLTCAQKKCVPQAACNEAILEWDAPTTNADGTCVNGLAGFNVYYGMDAGDGGQHIEDAGAPCIAGPIVACGDAGQSVSKLDCMYRVKALANGTWTFNVTAYSDAGVESTVSAGASKTIACP